MNTGFFYRVQRKDKFETLDLSQMTNSEILEVMGKYSPRELKNIIVQLVDEIRSVYAMDE